MAEPVTEIDDLEDFKETGGRDEQTVKRVRAAVKVVDAAGKSPQTHLQFRFGRLVVGPENPLRFLGKQFLFDEREILPDDFPHFVPDRFQFFVRGKSYHHGSGVFKQGMKEYYPELQELRGVLRTLVSFVLLW